MMKTWKRTLTLGSAAVGLCGVATGAAAQYPYHLQPRLESASYAKVGGSPNVRVVAHVPTGGYFHAGDIEIEQELSRPYVYVPRLRGYGFTIIDIAVPEKARRIYTWTIPDADLHEGLGAQDGEYFKLNGRYYYVQAFQFTQGTPDAELGAIVFDVTGLPDVNKVREVRRIHETEYPGGFHNVFPYKHSSGRVLMVATVVGPWANVYDLERVVAGGDPKTWLISRVPGQAPHLGPGGYHDFYVAYDPADGKDKLYAAGRGGYFVFDITTPEKPELLFSISGAAGVVNGHTFTPTPDGAFAVTETEYQYAPLRIFDLRPGQRGEVKNIDRPIGAWTADWRALSHNHEVRWPYVFVAAYEDGLQIFNMLDPYNPITIGWYYTCMCAHQAGWGGVQNPRGTSVMNGGFGVDVRNADGLIVLSDSETGFWAFRLEGFQGWNGEDWGMPNISSAQDWDRGPPIRRTRPGNVAEKRP